MLDVVDEFLELYSLEDAFEVLGVEPSEVVRPLLAEGLATLPPFLQDLIDDKYRRENEETEEDAAEDYS